MERKESTRIMCIIASGIMPIGLCLLLGNRLGLYFIVSLIAGIELFSLIVYFIVYLIRVRRLPRNPLRLCDIPSRISAPRADRFKSTVCTLEDAAATSERAIAFCKEKDMPEETAYYCGLCLEEIAVDTVKNRFDARGGSIDIRMIHEDGHITSIIRDDCEKFDPNEWLELCAPKDNLRSIGIRVAMSLAGDVNYVNSLGLNVLTIRW